jgi:hypothetical protein
MSRLSRQCGSLTSHNPIGLQGLLRDSFALLACFVIFSCLRSCILAFFLCSLLFSISVSNFIICFFPCSAPPPVFLLLIRLFSLYFRILTFSSFLCDSRCLSRYSKWLRAGRPRGRSSSPGKIKNCNFSISPKSTLRPTQRPIQSVPGALFPAVKQQGREADRSPPATAEVKKTWIYTSIPPYVFMA